jgi:hypothetical protein
MKKVILYTILSVFAFGICDDNADKLADSYSQISHCENNHIVWKDGTKMIYDDAKAKNFQELLNNPDIEDSFSFDYPLGSNSFVPPKHNYDPGRIRNEVFMKKLYGHNANEVKSNLVTISWMNKRIRVTRVNNIDKRLKAISMELQKLPKRFQKYLTEIGGTFNWRKISGTSRLSVHSFGAAIDINVKYSSYWKWSKGKYRYNNQIPKEIIEIFEKHNFIWGGKWYHYDTMHFEYRPELLR